MLRGIVVSAALVGLLAACPRPPPPPKCGPVTSGGFGAGAGGGGSDDDGFRTAGDELTVKLSLAMECPSDIEVKATVAVQDPANNTVALLEGEATRVVTERVAGVGMSTTVRVRAGVPGPYHFTARFEPNLGLVQHDVLVAENHRDAGPELVLPSSTPLRSCGQVDLSEDGRPLCLNGPVQVFSRDGALQQTLTSNGAAVRAGRVLWVRDVSTLARWVETDAGFERESDAGLTLLNNPLMAADSDGLLVAGSFEVHLVRWDGSQFIDQVDPNIVANNPVLVWKRGNEYAVLGLQSENSTLCTGRFRDAGTCLSGFTGGIDQVVPVASEPAGMWTWTPDFRTFPQRQNLGLRAPNLREFVLPLSWGVDGGGAAPFDTGLVLRATNGQRMFMADKAGSFVLQSFPGDPLQSVTSRWVTLRNSGGEVVIYRR